MADKEEVHPLVTLLLERMKSHPEEFEDDYAVEMDGDVESIRGRWQHAIQEIYNHGSDQDGDALREGMRTIRLDKAHKWALDELLNGDERRAQQRREVEEREKTYRKLAAAQAQGLAQVGGNQNAYPKGAFAPMLGGNQPSASQRFYDRLLNKLGI